MSPTPTPAAGPVVGAQALEFKDEARAGRPIKVELFYPAVESADVETETHAFIYSLRVARKGAYEPSRSGRGAEGPRGLLLLSHGTGGTEWDLFWLARKAVAAGWVVASVKHPGDTWNDSTPLSSLQVWERPLHLSRVLTGLLEHEIWGPRIDRSRIAAAGHSVGGFTVLGLAGLRYDIGRAFTECFVERMNDPTCVWVRQGEFDFSRIDYTRSGQELRDPRIRSVVAFTPAVAEAADVQAARDIAIPVLIVGARHDNLTPYELHAKVYASWVQTSELAHVDEGTHYTPVTACNLFGRLWLENCQDPPGLDRDREQARMGQMALSFLDRGLVPGAVKAMREAGRRRPGGRPDGGHL